MMKDKKHIQNINIVPLKISPFVQVSHRTLAGKILYFSPAPLKISSQNKNGNVF